MRRVLCTGLLGLLTGAAVAADYRAGAEDYREYLPRLQAGDRLRLEAGEYRLGLPLGGLSGSARQPILIEAADPARPPRFVARAGANTVSLVDVRYLVLRHLELDGRNLPVDAVKAEGHSRYADFITLEHLVIHDHAASQQNVGISTKCPAFGWTVRHNRVERVGTGMYFGDSDGSDAFVGGLIEGNRIAHTLGYNLQIKHQTSHPAEYADHPAGYATRHDTVIRHNVFSRSGAAPGSQARPNVLLGHVPVTGAGSTDRYLVYGNLFLHNSGEALLQAEGRVAVYNNVFVNGNGDAIHIQPHNDKPRDMAIFSNTVLASGIGIQVVRGNTAARQHVVANVVSAAVPLRGGDAAHNLALDYRADLLAAAVSGLTERLSAGQAPHRLPDAWMRALSAYPGWPGSPRPGAQTSPAWSRSPP